MFGGLQGSSALTQQSPWQQQTDAQRLYLVSLERRKAALHNLSSQFICHTFDVETDPNKLRALQQNVQNQVHSTPALQTGRTNWQKMMEDNPDPNLCYPVIICGFKPLEERVKTQSAVLQNQLASLEEAHKSVSELKHHIYTNTLTKLDACQKRNVKLQHQLVKLSALLEEFAFNGGLVTRNVTGEAQLLEKYIRLQDELRRPGEYQGRANELRFRVRSLEDAHFASSESASADGQAARASGGLGGGVRDCPSDRDLHNMLSIMDQQGEFLERLQDQLREDTKDFHQLEEALRRRT